MQRPIRILHLEHQRDSAKFQLKLQTQGIACDLLRIENRAEFISALARATKSHIRLLEDQKAIYCSIRDDGIGFDIQAAARKVKTHGVRLGLDRMRERISAVDGTLQILSAPGLGTDLHIGIPKEVTKPE